jgi:hypothetical protein
VACVPPAELFIAMLAFDPAPPVNGAKLGTFAGSLLASIIAAIILKTTARKKIQSSKPDNSGLVIRGFFFYRVGVKNAREGSAEEISFSWNWRDGHGVGGGGAARARL